jgi:predicted nucleotidyltransferase
MTKELNINDNSVKNLLSELENCLKNLFKDDLKKIILFGSYAKGNYDSESDLDIMVLIKHDSLRQYKHDVTKIALDLTIKYSILPSIMLENEQEYNKNIHRQFLFKNIENEGIELYAA